MWRTMIKNSWQLASKLAGNEARGTEYKHPIHSATTFLKSSCLEMLDKAYDEIDRSCSKVRFPFNFT